MIHIDNPKNCCGCESCVQRCPKQCIKMEIDKEGFSYPKVDRISCINCGLCETVCPVLNPYNERKPINTYAIINKCDKVRYQSSSGGVFTLLAESILKEGGVVFGAQYDKNWQVVLSHTENINGLSSFRGSKYSQARIENCFIECEGYLKNKRKVLFSGTPCQISALKHFLRKEYDNLLTVDIVCHGVPSPMVWRKYLEELCGTTANVDHVNMRSKQNGWHNYQFVIVHHKNGVKETISSRFSENLYMRAFLKNMILRPSCHDCKFKDHRSNSDITLADFWGINMLYPDMDDDKGTSLVMVHTSKGLDALNFECSLYLATNYDDGCLKNPSIYKSSTPWVRRTDFFNKIDTTSSIIRLMDKMLKPSFGMRLKNKLRSFIN